MKELIVREICQYVARFQQQHDVVTAWGEPIVGFASAKDPLFVELKKVVVESHALPTDLLPEARTVIAYFLPFAKSVTVANIRDELSAPQWAQAYIDTNRLIASMAEHLITFLAQHEATTVGIPATHNWIEDKLVANWSHRHIAYIAGLGRFGLNNMLITAKGCSGRIGSIVTSFEITPDSRPEDEACLYKYDGSCEKCVGRCVNESLEAQGFDRFKCYAQLMKNVEEYANLGYADVCGKCLAAVPCSHIDPVAAKKRAKALGNQKSSFGK